MGQVSESKGGVSAIVDAYFNDTVSDLSLQFSRLLSDANASDGGNVEATKRLSKELRDIASKVQLLRINLRKARKTIQANRRHEKFLQNNPTEQTTNNNF